MEPITLQGLEVAVVDHYKYLGVHVNSRLDWKDNSNAVYMKGMSRLYFLRKLRSSNVYSRLLEIFFCQSVVASALYFAVVCWGSSTNKRDIIDKFIDKLIWKAGLVGDICVSERQDDTGQTVLNHIQSRTPTPPDNRGAGELIFHQTPPALLPQ